MSGLAAHYDKGAPTEAGAPKNASTIRRQVFTSNSSFPTC